MNGNAPKLRALPGRKVSNNLFGKAWDVGAPEPAKPVHQLAAFKS